MSGDYSRFTFDPRRRFSSLYLQQGRLWLDQDKIEESDIVRRAHRTLAEDVLGRLGFPAARWPDAFRVTPAPGPDLSIGEGRLYVDGIQVEHFPGEGATYLHQPFLPLPPPLPAGEADVLLRVWDREITYVEDPRLLDVALGGLDTATRLKTVWQLLVEGVEGQAACGPADPFVSAGRLSTAAVLPPAPEDPCIVPPLSGYRGVESRLYMLKVHEGGPLGTARFSFSRDAGSVVSAVSRIEVGATETTLTVNRIGRDPVLRFSVNDWVTVTDDWRELMLLPAEPARVVDIDEANLRIVLDRVLPAHNPLPFGTTQAEIRDRHTKIIRWDQTGAPEPVDADGLIATRTGAIPIEDGIEVTFDMQPAGGSFLTGDYWYFAARPQDASVEILDRAPPRPDYHVAQVGAAHGLGGQTPAVDYCRPRPEDRGTACCCCEITVSPDEGDGADVATLAAAIALIPQVAPDESVHVVICLHAGRHDLDSRVDVTRRRVTIRGCGPGTILVAGRDGAIGLFAAEDAVEDLAIEGETEAPLIRIAGVEMRVSDTLLRNDGPGPTIHAVKTEDLTIERNASRGTGGMVLGGERLTIRGNLLLGGPLHVGPFARLARVEDNDLRDSREEGLLIGGRGVVLDIDILGNRIRDARGHGIASGHFDPEDEGGDGIIDRLLIRDNEITGCIARDADRAALDPPFAGIALGRVYDLVIRGNRIEGNGEETRQAVCGIYVRHSRGAEITGNEIARNGRPQGEAALPGLQGGILLMDARAAMTGRLSGEDDQVGFADLAAPAAAHVAGNSVAAPRGHALRIEGQGPMRIADNRFLARDLPGRSETDRSPFAALAALVSSVFVVNLGLPSWLGTLGIALGFDMVTTQGINRFDGDEILGAVTAGGHTQFRGNQVRLDLTQPEADIVLANVFVTCLDDAIVSDNQTEGIFSAGRRDRPAGGDTINMPLAAAFPVATDLLFADLFNIALTTRQTDNGLMTTPLLTMFSIVSSGIVNHCTHNQTTSCIIANGSSPKSVREGNAILYPHPSFCPDNDDVIG